MPRLKLTPNQLDLLHEILSSQYKDYQNRLHAELCCLLGEKIQNNEDSINKHVKFVLDMYDKEKMLAQKKVDAFILVYGEHDLPQDKKEELYNLNSKLKGVWYTYRETYHLNNKWLELKQILCTVEKAINKHISNSGSYYSEGMTDEEMKFWDAVMY